MAHYVNLYQQLLPLVCIPTLVTSPNASFIYGNTADDIALGRSYLCSSPAKETSVSGIARFHSLPATTDYEGAFCRNLFLRRQCAVAEIRGTPATRTGKKILSFTSTYVRSKIDKAFEG